MLKRSEGRWSLPLRQILKQLSRPISILITCASPDDTAHDLIIQEEVIGARRELDQAVGHEDLLSDLS
jgi:hypothetical protein